MSTDQNPTDQKSTVHLPKTDFPMKASLGQLEPRMLEHWKKIDLYGTWMAQNAQKPKFVFHDGPPYANNHIHGGHFLNKILKDIVAKFQNMSGRFCDFVPGWDCHGLPIELGVDKELGVKKRDMDKVAIRRACRAYAEKWIDVQREEFKRLGVVARWDKPYLTMNYGYEAQTVRELARFVEKGSVYRGKKPVHWCMKDQTALALAEIEYEKHTSPTIYVAFPAVSDLGGLASALKGRTAEFVIWTTTPWTLPANLAIAVNPNFEYVAYELNGRPLVIAKDLLVKVLAEIAPDELTVKDVKLPGSDGAAAFSAAAFAHPERILGYFEGKQLEGMKYRHVFLDRESPVILGEHVTLEAGSGLVHTAPGHGADDYIVGLKYGLEVLAPVDAAGRYTDEAGAQWAGKKVFDVGTKSFAVNPEIVAVLVEKKALLNDPKASFVHDYPVCWRCHMPVIFRATAQWFISMDKTNLRQDCLAEIEKVQWIPSWGRDRIHGMLAARPDWCISRQRTWGVPIPVVYCEGCDTELLDAGFMGRVADVMEKESADAWYSHLVEDFLAPGQKCAKCGEAKFRKENDILDVWFDSGVSFAAVAEKEPTMGLPVDLYLEGSDQHRGWFHSSLMCSVGTRGHAPYRTVLTHGFTVDERGEKESKSKGNFIPPEKLISDHGAEILRLWVSAADYANDVRNGPTILKMLSDSYRKLRNTLRYALGALDGFDPAKDSVLDRDLLPIDRWALQQLGEVSAKVLAAYARYEFHLVYQTVLEFSTSTLSATYFDIIKDRLYTKKKDGLERRSAQTALYAIASDLMRLLAPVLSFTTDEAWAYLPGQKPASVFLAGMPTAQASVDAELTKDFARLLDVRAQVLPALEELRKNKVIGKSEEARVTLDGPAELLSFLFDQKRIGLATLFIVSQVERGTVTEKFAVRGERAHGGQCPRCWKYYEALPVGGTALCAPCEEALR